MPSEVADGIQVVNQLNWRWEDYPGSLGGPNVITGPWMWKREAEESVSARD